MKKSIIILALTSLIFACKKDNTAEPTKTPTELLSLNAWQLDRYTDTSGKTISNTTLNFSAQAIFGLLIEFKENKETRALDKITKNILNRGTWDLNADNTILDINITGFKGKFKLISIKTGKLIIQAETDTFISGVGTAVNLEFSIGK